jgi:hypothetical protein
MTDLRSHRSSSSHQGQVAQDVIDVPAGEHQPVPLPARVLIINADRYRKPRILDLLGLRNDYVIVCGQIRSMHRWGHYSHPEATIKCLVAPEGESATDTTLVFHAGTLLATNPRLRHVPWLIVTQDRTLKSLLACLQHRKVRILGLLPLYEGGAECVSAYKGADAAVDDSEFEAEVSRAERSIRPGYPPTSLGHELDQFIREQGMSYPVKGTTLRKAIEAQPRCLSRKFHEALIESLTPGRTVTSSLYRLTLHNGFPISSTKVLAFNG